MPAYPIDFTAFKPRATQKRSRAELLRNRVHKNKPGIDLRNYTLFTNIVH